MFNRCVQVVGFFTADISNCRSNILDILLQIFILVIITLELPSV